LEKCEVLTKTEPWIRK